VEGTMEYLLATFGLVAMCGCALGAYLVLDGIEREQEQDGARAAERERGCRLGATSTPLWVATLRQPVPLATALEPRRGERLHGWGIVAAHADRLDGRVRVLEERLDQLGRARASAVRSSSG